MKYPAIFYSKGWPIAEAYVYLTNLEGDPFRVTFIFEGKVQIEPEDNLYLKLDSLLFEQIEHLSRRHDRRFKNWYKEKGIRNETIL
jgi:hypothetical protein